jgi:hypothetical protein
MAVPVAHRIAAPSTYGRAAIADRPLCLILAVLIIGLAGCGGPERDEEVNGPEWRTTLRSAVGAATPTDPARLTEIEFGSHDGFDRVTIRIVGPLPGYRVGYGSAAERSVTSVLTILLEPAEADGERLFDAGLAAVGSVHRLPSDEHISRTTVTMQSGLRLPFRVGISPDAVYVDVAHTAAVAGAR